jgi:hypothetical protein
MKKYFLFHLFCVVLLQLSNAQSIHMGGVFPTIDHSGTISKNLDYSLYYFGAFPLLDFDAPDIVKDAKLLLFYSEQALTYNANKQLSFSGSYVYQRENGTEGKYASENRLFVQATFKHAAKALSLKHRVRFDNRFVYNSVTKETPYTHRLRYLLGLECPLKSKKNNLYLAAYEEVFFNTFRNASSVYAENWAYVAIGFKLDERNKLETGPLYITWNTGGDNWYNQYYWQVTWLSHIDFTKRSKQAKQGLS